MKMSEAQKLIAEFEAAVESRTLARAAGKTNNLKTLQERSARTLRVEELKKKLLVELISSEM